MSDKFYVYVSDAQQGQIIEIDYQYWEDLSFVIRSLNGENKLPKSDWSAKKNFPPNFSADQSRGKLGRSQ